MQTLTPSTFNGFDCFLVLVLVSSSVAAFLRGIIKAVLSLVGLILGIVAGAAYYQPVAHSLSGMIASVAVSRVAAFLLIAFGIMLVFTVAANLLRKTVHAVGLGLFDRLLGAGFGFFRGCVLGSAVMMAAAAFMPDSGWIRTSQLAPYFLAGAHAVSFVVPEHFQQQVASGALQIVREAPDVMRIYPMDPARPGTISK